MMIYLQINLKPIIIYHLPQNKCTFNYFAPTLFVKRVVIENKTQISLTAKDYND